MSAFTTMSQSRYTTLATPIRSGMKSLYIVPRNPWNAMFRAFRPSARKRSPASRNVTLWAKPSASWVSASLFARVSVSSWSTWTVAAPPQLANTEAIVTAACRA